MSIRNAERNGPAARPRVGISACLLGQKVRYNGADKRDPVLLDALGAHVEWVPVCPEVEAGMGTPREPVRLLRTDAGVRMMTVDTQVDHTDAMNTWAATRLEELAQLGIAGYVLKKNSPSCGREDVPVFEASGGAAPGRGLFAEALLRRLPGLPIEEEDRLHDPRAVELFLNDVRAYHDAAPSERHHRPEGG